MERIKKIIGIFFILTAFAFIGCNTESNPIESTPQTELEKPDRYTLEDAQLIATEIRNIIYSEYLLLENIDLAKQKAIDTKRINNIMWQQLDIDGDGNTDMGIKKKNNFILYSGWSSGPKIYYSTFYLNGLAYKYFIDMNTGTTWETIE